MALVSMTSLMKHALENRYAVGYFESWNMESALGVIDAAERMGSPVIIGFGGQFIGSSKRHVKENIRHYAYLGKAIARETKVPVALLLNEAHTIDLLIKGMQSGFNAIMYEAHDISLEEFIAINRYLVQTAHMMDATVEAEIGQLPDADIASNTISNGEKTDPDQAAYFVSRTGVDALAVSVGNVHLLESGKAPLDFDLISCLRKKVKVPLVLHGGTGIDDEDLKHAISLGMCKVNVGTILKRVYIRHMQCYLQKHDVARTDPHNIIGRGGDMDMLCGAREAVAREVMRFIRIIGSENKAHLI